MMTMKDFMIILLSIAFFPFFRWWGPLEGHKGPQAGTVLDLLEGWVSFGYSKHGFCSFPLLGPIKDTNTMIKKIISKGAA